MIGMLAYSNGVPQGTGRIRVTPEDFRVSEDLGFEPAGHGEHVLVQIRKRAVNTDWVARRLAAFAGVPLRSVSYSGMKDRFAIAEQWFSVHFPRGVEPNWLACNDPTFEVLRAVRHARKLKRGAHKGNGFRIVIRDVRGDCGEVEARLQHAATHGVPNYFGPQRFGRNGENVARAEAMFLGRERVKDRYRRGLYMSAARAHFFNEVLTVRVARGDWNKAILGDVMMLDGTRSVFRLDTLSNSDDRRIAGLDIHATGPLWGKGELPSGQQVQALEQEVGSRFPVLRDGLEEAGLSQERRALRLRLRLPSLERFGNGNVIVAFHLPRGTFATTVLRELVVPVDLGR